MKFYPLKTVLLSASILTLLFACKEKEDPVPEEPVVNHIGEKWNITSVTYNLIDQNLTTGSQAIKIGTTSNAGAFYFNGATGSFDINIDTYRKQDYFNYSESTGDVTITSIAQSVSGSNFSQNVIVLSGDKLSPTSMTLQGTITKQTTASQFSLTGEFTLTKQ